MIINIILINLMMGESALNQFFEHFGNLFTGNWGISEKINLGQDNGSLILPRLPRTIDLLLLPSILGVIIGILLGRLAYKFRNSWIEKLIQFFVIIGISLPIFVSGFIMQRIFAYGLGLYPPSGFKTAEYEDPRFITGFRILDALFSGEPFLAIDYLNHLILPLLCLTISAIAFISIITRISMNRKSSEKTIISNTMITGLTFSLVFTFCVLLDNTFSFEGFGKLTIDAIREQDYSLLRASLFIIIIFLVIITFISNTIFAALKSSTISRKSQTKNISSLTDSNNLDETNAKWDEEKPYRDGINKEKRKFFHLISRYLYLLISLIMVVYIIILASFPQLISRYSFDEANGIFTGNWYPPSAGHPLGQGKFGRDVFARVLYGTRDALVFGLGTIVIGLLGGIPLGLGLSLRRHAKKVIKVVLTLVFIIPIVLLIAIIAVIIGYFYMYFILLFSIGSVLILIFALIIANFPLEKRNIIKSLKKVAIYIPLLLSFVILIYESLGFLGIRDPRMINWGGDISEAKLFLQLAPWALIWPGVYFIMTLLGFFLLHFGLKNYIAENPDSTRFIDI